MGLAKDDCGELMDRTVASSVIVPRPGLEVKGAAGRDSSEAVSVLIVGGKFVQQPGFRMFSATKALIWSYNMGLGGRRVSGDTV